MFSVNLAIAYYEICMYSTLCLLVAGRQLSILAMKHRVGGIIKSLLKYYELIRHHWSRVSFSVGLQVYSVFNMADLTRTYEYN